MEVFSNSPVNILTFNIRNSGKIIFLGKNDPRRLKFCLTIPIMDLKANGKLVGKEESKAI
jgi:hypothetical protein